VQQCEVITQRKFCVLETTVTIFCNSFQKLERILLSLRAYVIFIKKFVLGCSSSFYILKCFTQNYILHSHYAGKRLGWYCRTPVSVLYPIEFHEENTIFFHGACMLFHVKYTPLNVHATWAIAYENFIYMVKSGQFTTNSHSSRTANITLVGFHLERYKHFLTCKVMWQLMDLSSTGIANWPFILHSRWQ